MFACNINSFFPSLSQKIVAMNFPADCDNLNFLGLLCLFSATAWTPGLIQAYNNEFEFRPQ